MLSPRQFMTIDKSNDRFRRADDTTAAMAAASFHSRRSSTLILTGSIDVTLRFLATFLFVFLATVAVAIIVSYDSRSTSFMASVEQVGTEREHSVPNNDVSSLKSEEKPVKFVLYLGLDGSGQQFWQSLIGHSPLLPRLERLRLHPRFTSMLSELLFSERYACNKGMWSTAMCPASKMKVDVHENQQELARVLQDMQMYAESPANGKGKDIRATNDDTLAIPVNLINHGQNRSGHMSYPNWDGNNRGLQYPYLSLWYQACRQANVTCEHVYLHRDPVDVIRSAIVKRSNNEDTIKLLQLYTTMLHVQHSQLLFHGSDKIAGCWDYDRFFSDVKNYRELEEIKEMHGWMGEPATGVNIFHRVHQSPSFADTIAKLYRPTPTMTREQIAEILPSEVQPYLRAYLKMHEHVVSTCQRLHEERNVAEAS